jgi:NADPH:quinone reductase-like Zn-dependent oxidoreductase
MRFLVVEAALYEKQGAAREVLVIGETPDPEPDREEVCIRVIASGINPGDVKKRLRGATGRRRDSRQADPARSDRSRRG